MSAEISNLEEGADICSDRRACRGVAIQEGTVEQEETSYTQSWSFEDLKKYQRDDPDLLAVLQGKEARDHCGASFLVEVRHYNNIGYSGKAWF